MADTDCSPPTELWVGVTAAVPMWVAAGQLGLYGDGARDQGVVQAVGLGYAGGFRALDGWGAALLASVPVGTRTLRAELPSVVLLGLLAAGTFVMTRRIVVAVAGTQSWASVVACIGTIAAMCSAPLLEETGRPGSSLLGVVMVIGALLVERRLLAVALVSLAATYDPFVGLAVGGAFVSRALLSRNASPSVNAPCAHISLTSLPALFAGTVPLVLAALQARTSKASTSAHLLAHASFDGAGLRHIASVLEGELGAVMLLGSASGLVLAALSRRGRRAGAPLLVVSVAALLSTTLLGVSASAWTPVALVLLVLCVAFAAVAMQVAVLAVARARLPLASASAAMVVVLFAAFPAIMLDDALAHAATRAPLSVPTWEDAAFGGMPSGSLVLVTSPRLYARLLATEVMGDVPPDVAILPTFDAKNEASGFALSRDATLVPLFRDVALVGAPQELSMSTLAVTRPIEVVSDPRWERTLSRHLLPGGLFASFEPEPRGGADRKHALEATSPCRARLVIALASPLEAGLASITAAILYDRAIAALEADERQVAHLALVDAEAFAPTDPRLRSLLAKQESGRGSVDVAAFMAHGVLTD